MKMDMEEIVMVSQIETIYGDEHVVNEWLLKNPQFDVINVARCSGEEIHTVHYKAKAKWKDTKYVLLEKPKY